MRFLFHLLPQHTSTIKLLCCVGTPIKCSPRPAVADSGSVGLHGDGCCEPEETASLLGSSAGSLPALALANQLPVNLKPPPHRSFSGLIQVPMLEQRLS